MIRGALEGGRQSHAARHYAVENARIYTLPDEPPPIIVSGFGPKAVELAAPDRRRVRRHLPEAERVGSSAPGGGTKPGQGGSRSAGAPTRRRPSTAHRRGRTRRCPASSPRSCHAAALRAGARARDARTWSPGSVPCGPDARPARRGDPGGTWTPATTRSTSSRSAPTRRGSSGCRPRRWHPELHWGRFPVGLVRGTAEEGAAGPAPKVGRMRQAFAHEARDPALRR